VNIRAVLHTSVMLAGLVGLAACGGGGGGGGGGTSPGGANPDLGCSGQCAETMPANLTTADIQQVIAQAVQEANARGVNATIAVTDRVGNVLAIFQMTGASTSFTIASGIVNGISGLENLAILPTDLAAIAKAVTGSYLASEGNAFSTRTASHIVQEHFSPHELGAPGGPLFGVQFSQLPCGDFVSDASVTYGPHRSPLGLSADPGGFPLYKNGHPVGGIGVIADGLYSLDRNILDTDTPNTDEIIALAGQFGYAPPADRQADRITADGRTLRYSDATSANFLVPDPTTASYATALTFGGLIADSLMNAYNAGSIVAGTTFGTAASGIVAADTAAPGLYPGLDAFVLTDDGGIPLYAPTDGASNGGQNLTAAEVTQIMQSALDVANRARAQIRRPLDSQARVSITVVGPDGAILAVARTRDAPLFGTDVSVQKARTATFFSSTDADTVLSAEADVTYVGAGSSISFADDYVGSISTGMGVRAFLNDDTALANGIAFADRSGGNLSRPFYPDGTDGNTNGPFSKPFSTNPATNLWSPFSTGLQLDLIYNQLVSHLTGGSPTSCTTTPRLANGIQIFPGSVPIFKNGVLVGGIGVSGDGVDQDDMVSFLGVYNASIALGGDGIAEAGDPFIGNANPANRADTVTPAGFSTALRFIQCPQNPFLNSTEEFVCDGK
jgi:uncharacterized protein GlcG (DUF336 family)